MIRRLAALVIVLVGAVDLWLFVVPHDQKPVSADAVVVLSGQHARLPVGIKLVREGKAPLLVVSRSDRPARLEQRACAQKLGIPVLCRRAVPYSTQGEARLIASLAAARNWRAVDVVTSAFHIYRAHFMLRRCYHGGLAMVSAPNPTGFALVKSLAIEPVKLVYHELRRGC